MNILKINGVELPTPSAMTPSDYDITEAVRNARGFMIMEMIRANVHKLECSWNYLTPDQYKIIRDVIAPKYNLAVEYVIPETATSGTIYAYAGNRTSPIYTYKDGYPAYQNVTINFIEM